jgi:oligopeptide/dipeptide ABC transporter ATP-binding protein
VTARAAGARTGPGAAASPVGPILEVEALTKHFPVKRPGVLSRIGGQVRAVDGVSFTMAPGETLGLVGESGCGKSTVARLLVKLLDPTGGSIRFEGRDITRLSGQALRRERHKLQIVFQDPYGSLNPRRTVSQLLSEPLEIAGMRRAARDDRIASLLGLVGLAAHHAQRYPHEFSGGQRQRIGIARALALRPKLVVCDEPVSALDVSVQAQIINLLEDVQAELGLSYLFVAHDLSVVRHISDRVAVMYLGKLVELAEKRELFTRPQHPYTQALMSAVPIPRPGAKRERIVLRGDLPSPLAPPGGCRFNTRCPHAMEKCRTAEPPLVDAGGGHLVACHLVTPDAAAPGGGG